MSAVSCRCLAMSCDTVPVHARALQRALRTHVVTPVWSQLGVRVEGKKTVHTWLLHPQVCGISKELTTAAVSRGSRDSSLGLQTASQCFAKSPSYDISHS